MNDKNTYKLIDLFSGCGGLSLGLEQAGFDPVLYNELNPSAAASYLINRNENKIDYIADIHNMLNLSKYKGIDLVCGGPPCQGYSGIGHRRTYNVSKDQMLRNTLYKEMSRVIKSIEPKLFLFENVKGLLSSKWNPSGRKGEIFIDVLSDFIKKLGHKYAIRWDLVKSSSYGVPQNRPRVFIVGIHKDLKFNSHSLGLKNSNIISLKSGFALKESFLPKPATTKIPNPQELLSDLIDNDYNKNGLSTKFYKSNPGNELQKELRKKSLNNTDYYKKGDSLLEQEYSKHKLNTIEKFNYMLKNNGKIPANYKTKKFSQRILPCKWNNNIPNITITSLPDDYVHYSQPRILTVREWARFQTFPDWYRFAGKRTTGGARRSGKPDSTADQIELPKYTQIGNAVPVKLANYLGQNFIKILED